MTTMVKFYILIQAGNPGFWSMGGKCVRSRMLYNTNPVSADTASYQRVSEVTASKRRFYSDNKQHRLRAKVVTTGKQTKWAQTTQHTENMVSDNMLRQHAWATC
jgi:hypothetical protein